MAAVLADNVTNSLSAVEACPCESVATLFTVRVAYYGVICYDRQSVLSLKCVGPSKRSVDFRDTVNNCM
jgi:hypothetical protein